MDYETPRAAHFTDTAPESSFGFSGARDTTLFIAQFDEAVAYSTQVLGKLAYVEGDGTRG